MHVSCFCGRSKDKHGNEIITEEDISRNESVTWNPDVHLREEATDAYSDIEFHGAEEIKRAQVSFYPLC